jgi:hypothetical protein
VASTRAAELRQRHRKTRLAEYGQHFQKTLGPVIDQWLVQAEQKLTRPYSAGRMSFHDMTKPLPPGMESMRFEGNTESILLAVTVGYYGHAAMWLFVARVAVRGDEGVLLALVTRISNPLEFSQPWDELMQFNPKDLPPPDDFTRHFNEYLSRAIEVLSDDVERN